MDPNHQPARIPATPRTPAAPASTLADEEFLVRFEAATLGPAEYAHRDHVRTVWLYLRRRGREGAESAVRDGIRRLSAAHGAPGRYHETLTLAWIALVASAVNAATPATPATPAIAVTPAPPATTAESGTGDFDELLRAHPGLLEREAPLRFYSPERLWSDEARAGWVEPDLAPLPG